MSIIEKPADIIHHIIGEELDTANLSVDSAGKQIAINAHSGWKMGFTVHKKINSKNLIEGIAKESRLFPFLKGDKLSFNSILDTYDETSIEPPNGFTIKDSDVISYRFNRTRIENIKTKVVLNYHHDYATDDFKKSTKSLNIYQTAKDFFENDDADDSYANGYYGIDDDQEDGTGGQGGDPIEVKHIRHDFTLDTPDDSQDDQQTIAKLQQFLLLWYCNQHTTCKIKLPLSYLYAEIGDIVAFPELLNGKKAYGEDYSLLLPETVYRNGQQILPYWMVMGVSKTLEYVELDLIQLHNLTAAGIAAINIAPEISLVATINGVEVQSPINVDVGQEILLDASGTSDVNVGDALTFAWSLTPEASDTLVADGDTATFYPPSEEQTYTVALTVTDSGGLSDSALVQIIVNQVEPFINIVPAFQDVTLDRNGTTLNYVVTSNMEYIIMDHPYEEHWINISPTTNNNPGIPYDLVIEVMNYGEAWNNPGIGPRVKTIQIEDINDSSIIHRAFTITQNSYDSQNFVVSVSYHQGWNYFSVPVGGLVDQNIYEVFGDDLVTGTGYYYDVSYLPTLQAFPGVGMVAYFGQAGSVDITGTQITNLPLSLNAGWNLISGISETTDVSAISDPGGIIFAGSCYGFSGAMYQNSSVLTPGKGYWINASTDGDITISSPS